MAFSARSRRSASSASPPRSSRWPNSSPRVLDPRGAGGGQTFPATGPIQEGAGGLGRSSVEVVVGPLREIGAMRRLLHRLAERRIGGRWDPLAALGFAVIVTALYAVVSRVFPSYPRGWVGVAIIAGAILVNG